MQRKGKKKKRKGKRDRSIYQPSPFLWLLIFSFSEVDASIDPSRSTAYAPP
jgi:hypothetical protein